MRKIYFLSCIYASLVLISCTDHSGANKTVKTDSPAVTNSIDSAANNGILPPSAAPGNANNSSVADSTYKAGDSSKK